MDEENCQAPLDISALQPLLSKSVEGLGELDKLVEIPIQVLYHLIMHLSKNQESISVKPKAKVQRRKNNKMNQMEH